MCPRIDRGAIPIRQYIGKVTLRPQPDLKSAILELHTLAVSAETPDALH